MTDNLLSGLPEIVRWLDVSRPRKYDFRFAEQFLLGQPFV